MSRGTIRSLLYYLPFLATVKAIHSLARLARLSALAGKVAFFTTAVIMLDNDVTKRFER
jgi:hypothetical protein